MDVVGLHSLSVDQACTNCYIYITEQTPKLSHNCWDQEELRWAKSVNGAELRSHGVRRRESRGVHHPVREAKSPNGQLARSIGFENWTRSRSAARERRFDGYTESMKSRMAWRGRTSSFSIGTDGTVSTAVIVPLYRGFARSVMAQNHLDRLTTAG
jgi:hypothetical protein